MTDRVVSPQPRATAAVAPVPHPAAVPMFMPGTSLMAPAVRQWPARRRGSTRGRQAGREVVVVLVMTGCTALRTRITIPPRVCAAANPKTLG